MNARIFSQLGAVVLFGCGTLSQSASAATDEVAYNHLVSSATAATPLAAGDTLFIDTFTTERGLLSQITTFTVAPGVSQFTGYAAWEVTTPDGNAPRLVDVNINIFNNSSGFVYTDTFAGVLAGFAHSTVGGPLDPGTYTLVATGTGLRDSSLDISLTMAAVPEADSVAMLLAGLGLVGVILRPQKSAS